MSPEKQRIAIATACGWTRGHTGQTQWVNDPHGIRAGWASLRAIADVALPDYLNDLNACHEMEKVLTDEQTAAYITTLCLEVQPDPMLHHATAAEKCEAFLRTLGLWEEDAQ